MTLSVYAPPDFSDIAAVLDTLAEHRGAEVHTNSRLVAEAADVLGMRCVVHVPNFRLLSAALPVLACELVFSARPSAAVAFAPTRPDACFDEFVRISHGVVKTLEVL